MSIQIMLVSSDGTSEEVRADEFMKRHVRQSHVDRRLKSVKKDDKVPRVGDTVRLNDIGLTQIFGKTSGLAHMKNLEMVVTQVDDESMTYPDSTFCLEVDNPDINQFLIDHHCFDIVRRA